MIEARLRELIQEWRDDAKEIRAGCADQRGTNVPCSCCEWHATGLEQAASELEEELAKP